MPPLLTMKHRALHKKIKKLEKKQSHRLSKLGAMKRKLPLEEVEDYEFEGWSGPERLSDLFGAHKDLIVVHNMGASCRFCTLWADGYNGLTPHLENRTAFAVCSPDKPAAQKKFAAGRGWKFHMISGGKNSFAKDMGYQKGDDPWPGVSTFLKKGKKIYRVATAPLGPFDPFCAIWPLFDLLAGGVKGWEPQYKYAKA